MVDDFQMTIVSNRLPFTGYLFTNKVLEHMAYKTKI